MVHVGTFDAWRDSLGHLNWRIRRRLGELQSGYRAFRQSTAIARSFTLTTDTGWGVRIDSPTMPDMSGARIGPYQFQAIWHSPKGDVPVTLIIDTDVKYFDAKGQEILSGDLTKTEKITESLSSVEVEPARK